MSSKGKDGEEWLKQLPLLLEELKRKWSLNLGEPFLNSYCNYVTKATTQQGLSVVLKVCFSQEEFTRETEYFALQAGGPMPKLHEIDPSSFAFLIEAVRPGMTLDSLEDEEKQMEIVTHLMREIWKPVPNQHNFTSLETLYTDFLRLREDPRMGEVFSPAVVRKAQSAFETMQSSSSVPVVLHGDLHHFNVLFDDIHHWLAIDPVGFVGDPAYDIAAYLRNPPRIGVVDDLRSLLRNRILTFSRKLDISEQRILQWGVFQTVLSAWWAREDGSTFLNGFEKTALTLAEMDV